MLMNNVIDKDHIIGFKEYLVNNGYSKHIIPIYIRKIKRFFEYKDSAFLQKKDYLKLKQYMIDYVDKVPQTSQKALVQAAIHLYYYFITGKYFLYRMSLKNYDLDVNIELEIQKFRKYLKELAGLCDSTIASTSSTVKYLLYSSFSQKDFLPQKILFSHVHIFISKTLSHLSKESKKTIIVRVRNYIRYLEFSYGLKSEAILKLPMTSPVWKRSSQPKYLTNIELERLFSSYDRKNSYGIRDYAIARCLSDLALRCSEVSGLSLDDFNWVEGTITIKNTKTHSQRTLPLNSCTGKAIESYLLHCRPNTIERTLFVRYKNQKGQSMGTSQIRNTIRNAAIRARLDNFTGAHTLRHTVAKNMINNGIGLKTIADILGHKSIETTLIYTKLNFTQLQDVAGIWPEDRL